MCTYVCNVCVSFVQGERDSYYRRISAAERHPNSYVSVIIDGSDNSQYHLPYFVHRDSDSNSAWKIGLHLFGAIVHGVGPQLFPVYDTCPLGTNATIDVLHHVLVAEYARRGGSLPPVLYLQLDNTVRQCKSRFVMAWLGLLVHWRVFQDVFVSFLPKGHTHEDIDQLFSQLAMWFRKHDAASILGFESAIASAIKYDDRAPTNIKTLDRVANIRDWVEPLLAKMDGISQDKHQFRITRINVEGGNEVRIMNRNWIARKGHNVWGGFKAYEYNSAVFNKTKETKAILARGAAVLRDGLIPPIDRKSREVSQNSGKKRKVVPGKKLAKSVEKIAVARQVSEQDYDSLMDSVAIMNSLEELSFGWSKKEIEVYQKVSKSRPIAQGVDESVDHELMEAIAHHDVGTVWVVRADFEKKRGWKNRKPFKEFGWKKQKKERLELFWLVHIDRGPERSLASREVTVQCTYYEKTKRTAASKKTPDERPWWSYKLGASTNPVNVGDLQIQVKLNQKQKDGSQGIQLTSKKKHILRYEKRVWAAANKWTVPDAGAGSDSDSDHDLQGLNR